MKSVSPATAATIVATIGAILMAPGAHAADINVFVTGAARRAYNTLIPQFERASGHKLVNQYALPQDLIQKMEAGEPFDHYVDRILYRNVSESGMTDVSSTNTSDRSEAGVARQR